MTDPLELVLIVSISAVSITFVIVGIQVFYLSRDLRKTNTKVYSILDDAQKVTSKLAQTGESMKGFMFGIKTAISLLNTVKGNNSKDGK